MLVSCGTRPQLPLPTDAAHASSMPSRAAHLASLPINSGDKAVYSPSKAVPLPPRSTDSWPEFTKPAYSYAREIHGGAGTLVRGDRDKKLLALTFDDGPHSFSTPELLALLKRTHTVATFFVIGKQVDQFPNLVKMEVDQGDEVGDHTYDHVSLTQIPPELIPYELDKCRESVMRASGGYVVHYFRPPGGDYNREVLRQAVSRSYVTTLWTDDPGDYTRPSPDVVLQRLLDHLENGGIILLHDGIVQTMDILPAFIAEARRRGYEFVTVSDLQKSLSPSPPSPKLAQRPVDKA